MCSLWHSAKSLMLDFGPSITVRGSTMSVMLSAPTRASPVPNRQPWYWLWADPNRWTSVPVVRVVGRSLNKKKRPGSEKVVASTVVWWDTWHAIAPTKPETLSVPLPLRWSSSRMSLRTPSVAVTEEEIGVVELAAKASREMLRPTAA